MSVVNLICKRCQCSFSTPKKRFNYLVKCGHKNFYCSRNCFVDDKTASPVERLCLYCKSPFMSSEKRDARTCCSDLCAHKYAQTFTDPRKVSKAATEAWKRREFVHKQRICIICGEKFERRYTKCCSDKCAREQMSIGGRKSAEIQRIIRSSKNEGMFANLCKSSFTNVLTNKRMFNGWDADVILPNEKVAVLWNGNWHRKKLALKHSVEQVKTRDRIKLDEIKKMGYTAYIIEDNGKFNSQFVNDEFEKFKLFISNIAVPSGRICLS